MRSVKTAIKLNLKNLNLSLQPQAHKLSVTLHTQRVEDTLYLTHPSLDTCILHLLLKLDFHSFTNYESQYNTIHVYTVHTQNAGSTCIVRSSLLQNIKCIMRHMNTNCRFWLWHVCVSCCEIWPTLHFYDYYFDCYFRIIIITSNGFTSIHFTSI